MKLSSVLKVLGAAAAVAALTPYEVEKDDETGITTMKALLWRARHTPATEETGRDIDVTFGLNLPRQAEAELFADDDPDAAVLDADELQLIADEAQEAADEVQAIADEAQEAADKAQEAADEAQAIADKAQAAADEAAVALEADDDDETDSEF